MELWILAAICAAFFQTLRFMLQKHLATATLSASGATYARFVYSLPFVLAALALWISGQGAAMPSVGAMFWGYSVMGAMSQILATLCVVMLFKMRNFAVGITFKKTEVLQTALVAVVLLGEGVSLRVLMAMLVGLAGVLLLTPTPGGQMTGWRRFANRASGLGLLSGLLFGVSGVSYRGATLAVLSDDPILRAAVTLSFVVLVQVLALTVWLTLREPGQIGAVWGARRVAVWMGITSMVGSISWMVAFTLQHAAYVTAVGQVELIFSLLASVLVFREKIAARELAGIALLTLSIVGIVIAV